MPGKNLHSLPRRSLAKAGEDKAPSFKGYVLKTPVIEALKRWMFYDERSSEAACCQSGETIPRTGEGSYEPHRWKERGASNF